LNLQPQKFGAVQLVILLLVLAFQVSDSTQAKTLNWTRPGDAVDEKPLKKWGNVAVEESPDWLNSPQVVDLLAGNTITALSKNGKYRWWIYFSDSPTSIKKAVWADDQGKFDQGAWATSKEGALCTRWKSSGERCRRVRHSGKVVRLDDAEGGKPTIAAVLYSGDPQGLAER
jgi:hypothetical protein